MGAQDSPCSSRSLLRGSLCDLPLKVSYNLVLKVQLEVAMSGDKVRIIVAAFAGLAVGCAIVKAGIGQSLAVMSPSVDMASQPALFSQSKFMQPVKPSYRASTKASAISGLTPCA